MNIQVNSFVMMLIRLYFPENRLSCARTLHASDAISEQIGVPFPYPLHP
jgi:hypothetical protein